MSALIKFNGKKSIIKRTQCPDNKRLEFLPRYVGNQYKPYEKAIYDFLSKVCEDYNGGYWNYYSLSNGGFYMALDTSATLEIEQPNNYYYGIISADAACIAVNLFVLCHFAWTVDEEWFTLCFHKLRAYALQHKEAKEILKFID